MVDLFYRALYLWIPYITDKTTGDPAIHFSSVLSFTISSVLSNKQNCDAAIWKEKN